MKIHAPILNAALMVCKPLLLLLALLMASGCQTQTSVLDGSGFSAGHPSSATRKFIVANDMPFAQWLAAHNQFCATQPGCRK